MSLLEDLHTWYKMEKYPADGPDLDMEVVDGEWVLSDTHTEQVSYKVIDDSPRWGDVIEVVYFRDNDETPYVAVQDVRPATESQDWGDYGDPTIFEVRPVEVTVVNYERV